MDGRSETGAPHSRDRDARGRANNARPRDELGRPLPYGSPGVDRIAEDVVLPPEEALAEAQRLLADGRPFHAHEVLEAVWKAAPEPERELWRGLAQLAVGLTHVARGNTAGGARLLRRAAGQLAPYGAQAPHDVDATGLAAWAEDGAVEVETAGPGAVPAVGVPRLTRSSARAAAAGR